MSLDLLSLDLVVDVFDKLFAGLNALDEGVIEDSCPAATIQKARTQYLRYAISTSYHLEYAYLFLQLALWFRRHRYDMFSLCRLALQEAGVCRIAGELNALPGSLRKLKDEEIALLVLIDCEEYRLCAGERKQRLDAILELEEPELKERIRQYDELHHETRKPDAEKTHATLLRALGYIQCTRTPANPRQAKLYYEQANHLYTPERYAAGFERRLAEVARLPGSFIVNCWYSLRRLGSVVPYLPSLSLRRRAPWLAASLVSIPFISGLPCLHAVHRLTLVIAFIAVYLILVVLITHIAYELEVQLIFYREKNFARQDQTSQRSSVKGGGTLI